jgi:hypothetical protein
MMMMIMVVAVLTLPLCMMPMRSPSWSASSIKC